MRPLPSMLYDVFISHASEDKDVLVRPLANQLREEHVEVWYDEFSLEIGDSLLQSINHGLAHCNFAIVVISPDFFTKGWTQAELNAVFARQINERRQIILPVWHNITKDEIVAHFPMLADILAVDSSRGVPFVVEKLLKKLRPEESPLIVAREILRKHDWEPPIISDEWWLDMVTHQERLLNDPSGLRWIFPLPHNLMVEGQKRGENIASTALQCHWAQEAFEEGYCQLTHPEKLHKFLCSIPGLLETARAHPRFRT